MYTCLLASGSSQGAEKLKAFLWQQMPLDFIQETSGGAARRQATQRAFDFGIINAPLQDEFGLDLAADLVSGTWAQVLLIVPSDLVPEFAEKGEAQGVLVIGKPVQPLVLQSALHWMKATRGRLLGLQEKNQKLRRQMEDVRLVDRAKCLLIASLSMSEAQAHKHIERQAMDLRVSKTEVARKIIQIYDV